MTLVFALLPLVPAADAAQGIPYRINFQGRLADNNGNILPDGYYNIKFRIFDAATAGTNLWQEDRIITGTDNRVQVTNGLFSVQFGSLTALNPSVFNSTNQRWLEVELPSVATNNCGTNGCAVFSEGPFTPRHALAASPYAYVADTIDGLDGADLAQIAAANTLTNTNTFSKSGGAGIVLSGSAASGGSILQMGSALSSGSANGTYLSSNGAFTGDLLNLQVSNATKLKVDNSGNLTLAAGASITIGASAGAGTTCSGGQFLQDQVVVGGIVTGGTCATPSGTGANTTLSNLGTTSINAALLPSGDNTRAIGSAGLVWSNVFAALVDAGSTTTTLGVGTANATAITIGRATATLALVSSGLNVTTAGAVSGVTSLSLSGAISGGTSVSGSGNFNTTGGTIQTNSTDRITNGGALTNITGYTQSSGTSSLTSTTATGDITSITNSSLAPAAAASANLLNGTFTAGSTNGSGNSTVNGILLQPTVNTSGAGTKAINGIAVGAPTITACTAGNCTIDGLKVTTLTSGAAATITSQGLDIQATGIGAGTLTGLNISGITAGAGTETALVVGAGWDNVLSVGGTAIINSTGVVQSAGLSGSYTNITGVGALAAGSIASGFGTIATANTITGTTINGTTGINTGAGAGTLRLDSNGALSNITSISLSGAISGGSSISGSGNFNTTGGTIQTNSTDRITNGGGLTNITGYTQSSGTHAVTSTTATGDITSITDSSLAPAAAASANLLSGTFTAGSSNGAGNSTVNGILLQPTINTSGAGTKAVNGIAVGAPTITGCASGACTIDGLKVSTITSGAAASITSQGLDIQSAGIGAGTLTGINISGITAGAGTETALVVGAGWDNVLSVGGTAIINSTGVVQSAGLSGSYTNITGVGALAAGSIASGFGTIVTANTITGTTINGTTGINTGAGAGTLRLDANGALSNITSLSLSGAISGGTSFSGSGNFNTTGGTIQTNSTDRITNGGALTNITGYTQSSGTHAVTSAATTGDVTSITDTALAPAAAASANLLNTSFTAGSSNGAGNSTVNGILLQPTVNTSGAGTKAINGVAVGAPTITGCASGTCTIDGLKVSTITSGAAASITSQGIDIQSAGISAGALTGLNISNITAGGGTETALVVGSGWDNVLSVGGTAIINSTGVVQSAGISGSYGNITGVGALAAGSIASGFGTIVTGNSLTVVGVNSGTGLIQGTGGLAVSGAASSINASSNFATNINTGNSNGAVTIGNTLAGAISLQTASTVGIQDGTTGTTFTVGNTTSNPSVAFNGSGTFATTTGAVSLKGDTSVSAGKTFTANGNSLFKSSVDSASAFQIQNANSARILAVDTTDGNFIVNPSFEPGTTGWTNTGTGSAIAQSNTAADSMTGTSSLQVTSGTTANGGAVVNTAQSGFTAALTVGTYTLSFYAKANTVANSFADLSVTMTGGGPQACNLNSTTVNTSGFQRYFCTFTTTGSNVTAINIGESGTTSHVFFLDGVQLESGTYAAAYGIGSISFGSTISSPLIVAPAANSATALRVQNGSGSNVFNIDTTDTNLFVNPGFETGLTGGSGTGWTANGANTTLTRDTTQAYLGAASAKIAITPAAVGGAQYNLNPVVTAAATTYAVSFYALLGSGTAPTFQITYSPDNSATNTCSPGGTAVTTGWVRFSCTVTHATTPTTSGYIRIAQTNSAVSTWYIDGIQLESGSTATAYGAGSFTLNGIINSPVTIKNNSDSTTTFQVQNSSSASILTADTLNKTVIVGSNTTDTTQILLQLDSFSTFADTAGCTTTSNQGALYYNTNTTAIRGCINGAWEDVVSTAGLGLLAYGVVPDSGSGAGDLLSITSAGVNGPCKVSFLTTTTVKIVQGCTAFSGGRKVVIPDNTTPTGSLTFTNNNFVHVCLTGANNQPAFSASGTEAANQPTFSVTAPVLCLADIKTTAAAIANIYDVRTFTITDKTFATLNAATGFLGAAVSQTGTAGVLQLANGVAQVQTRGVVVATAGSAAANNTVNMIIAIRGPQFVKATGTSGVQSYVQATATAGYTSTAAVSANAYGNIGISQRTIDTLCTLTTNCQFSQFTEINIK